MICVAKCHMELSITPHTWEVPLESVGVSLESTTSHSRYSALMTQHLIRYRYTMHLIRCVGLHFIEGNSGCINSIEGDMRYKVYIRGFSYLDYSFDILSHEDVN